MLGVAHSHGALESGTVNLEKNHLLVWLKSSRRPLCLILQQLATISMMSC